MVIVAVVVLAYYALAVFRTLAAAEMVMEVEKDVTKKNGIYTYADGESKSTGKLCTGRIAHDGKEGI